MPIVFFNRKKFFSIYSGNCIIQNLLFEKFNFSLTKRLNTKFEASQILKEVQGDALLLIN